MNAQGVETTAAFGATQRVWTYVRMAAMALGAAGSAMAVQNIGAGQWSRIGQIMTMGIVFNLVLTGGLIVLVLSTDRQALSLFLAGDGQTMVIAQHILKLRTWGLAFDGFFGAVRGNGQVVWPLVILFVSLYPIRIGLLMAHVIGWAWMLFGGASR